MIQFGMDEYIPSPRIDLVFKSIFSQDTPESRGALMSFLSSIIGRVVTDVSIQENEPAVERLDGKQATMDINCKFNNGEQANVEIQLRKRGNMCPRSEYYLCKLHSGQAVKGDKYEQLHFTFQITILDYHQFPEPFPFLNEYELRNQDGVPLDGSRIRLYFLELTKLKELLDKPVNDLSRSEKWALFFKYADNKQEREKINELIRGEEGLEMASEMLEKLAKDDAMRVTLLSLEKAENDRINDLLEARDEGIEIGLQRGLQKGRQEGRLEGRLKGKQEGRLEGIRELIQSMAGTGMPVSDIAKYTLLPINEIQDLLRS